MKELPVKQTLRQRMSRLDARFFEYENGFGVSPKPFGFYKFLSSVSISLTKMSSLPFFNNEPRAS